MKQPLRIFLLLITLSLLFAACGGATSSSGTTGTTPAPAPVTLNVFAAASLTESFNEIKTQYQAAHPNIKLVYNFNGSQILVQQITNGAPADVFASADQANMKKATDAGAITGEPQVFARNRLVVIVPANNPGNINSLQDLARKGVKIVVAAPAVPVGKYGLQALQNMAQSPNFGAAFLASVKANVVSQEDNVKAVVQKVQLGEADAGIVYRTDVTAAVADKVKVIDIPDPYNVVAQYPIAVTKNSAHPTDAQAFVQYVLSPEGQAVLAKYHFISPSGS